MPWQAVVKQKIKIPDKVSPLTEGMAEFLGTFVLMVFGIGANAQNTLGGGVYGNYLSVNFGWGLGVTMGVYACGGVSGGHINPAVTLANALLGRLTWWKTFIYMMAQYLAAFAASACIYGVYLDQINHFDGGERNVTGPTATAGIFGTYPQDHVSTWTGLGDQILGTSMLLICVFAITDQRNMFPPKGMVPFVVGLVVVAIGMTIGLNCGYAINPARDLGPRLFTLVGGWGTATFSYRNYNWFWVPIVGPHVGAILGSWMYLLFVGNHIPESEEYELQHSDITPIRAVLPDGTIELINGIENTDFHRSSEIPTYQ